MDLPSASCFIPPTPHWRRRILYRRRLLFLLLGGIYVFLQRSFRPPSFLTLSRENTRITISSQFQRQKSFYHSNLLLLLLVLPRMEIEFSVLCTFKYFIRRTVSSSATHPKELLLLERDSTLRKRITNPSLQHHQPDPLFPCPRDLGNVSRFNSWHFLAKQSRNSLHNPRPPLSVDTFSDLPHFMVLVSPNSPAQSRTDIICL